MRPFSVVHWSEWPPVPALWKVVFAIRNPSALSCWPYLLLAPSTEPGSDFPQSPHWKTPRKGIPEPSPSPLPDGISRLLEKLCLSSFALAVCKPGSPGGSVKGTGCHFHQHTTHKDPVQSHGSDGDNAKPNGQQKPLEPSLFLDLGRRKADLGGRSLEIDSCLLPRRMSKGNQPTADGAVVHKTFSRCPWSLLSRTSSGPLLLPKYNPKL